MNEHAELWVQKPPSGPFDGFWEAKVRYAGMD